MLKVGIEGEDKNKCRLKEKERGEKECVAWCGAVAACMCACVCVYVCVYTVCIYVCYRYTERHRVQLHHQGVRTLCPPLSFSVVAVTNHSDPSHLHQHCCILFH